MQALQPQLVPSAVQSGAEPNVTGKVPLQMNVGRLGPQISTPVRSTTLDPEKEIMKGITFKYEEEEDDDDDDDDDDESDESDEESLSNKVVSMN